MVQDTRSRKPVRPGFVVSIVLAGIILAAGATAALRFDRLPAARTPARHQANGPQASRLAALDRQAAKLPRYRHHVRPLFADAMKVTSAIEHGRFGRANRALERSLKQTSMNGWYYAPFAAFIEDIPLPGNAHFREQLDRWVRQDANAPMPYLVRAVYYFRTGWRVRGNRFANVVEPAHMQAFSDDMQQALQDLGKAMHLGGDNPYTAGLVLEILQAHGDSPLKMLYLDLYDALLNTATVHCYQPKQKIGARCVRQTMQQLVTAGLDRHVYRLLNSYDKVDKADFSSRVEGLIGGMIGYQGGQRYSSAILQLAAQAMHSDTRLVADDTGHNNYVIDMSVVYGRTHDLHHMLSELRRYHYLYDAKHESDNNMAIAYNNRCYAEMHLGKLRAALKDCNASLRYGNLPDAYAKQQKLIRRLKAAGESTAGQPKAPTHEPDASM